MSKRQLNYLGAVAVLVSSAAIAEYKGDITPLEAFERASTESNV
jgi:hypothetical protein